jgi:succinate dehydrogenase flavin-adding protein (antitoxin of CptAB toxin-antitoxin module)
LELDLVLGKWVEEHIYSMDENGVKALIDVLDLVNNNSPSLHLLVSMSFYD